MEALAKFILRLRFSQGCLKKYPVAQAFQPVPAHGKACGYRK